MQCCLFRRILCQFPWFVRVDIGIDYIGLVHDGAQCLAILAALVQRLNLGSDIAQVGQECIRIDCPVGGDLAIESFCNEAGSTAGNIHVLADQIRIDA